MCLLVIAVRQHPRLPLIVAANRDEFHGRPTQDAHWWPDHPHILGGRDLQAGGTWLAVHRNGRFAAVTNHRDAKKEHAGLRSRGELVTGFLLAGTPPLEYLRSIDGDTYAGFNLIAAEPGSVAYLSNRGAAMRELHPGIWGLSNATLDDAWVKVTRSREALQRLVEEDDVNETSLMRLLGDRERAPSAEVRTDGLPFATAHALTAPFVLMPDYGTRCSTVLTVDDAGHAHFVERRFDPGGINVGESRVDFSVAAEDPQ